MSLQVFALTIGLLIGVGVVEVLAQAVPRFVIGSQLECAFDQAAPSLAEAQAMKAEFSVVRGTTTVVAPTVVTLSTCSGGASPFQCKFTLPAAAANVVGAHTLTYRTGNLEVDGTTSYGTPVVNAYIIDPPLKGAPAQPTNSVIRKIIGGIASMFKAMFGWMG